MNSAEKVHLWESKKQDFVVRAKERLEKDPYYQNKPYEYIDSKHVTHTIKALAFWAFIEEELGALKGSAQDQLSTRRSILKEFLSESSPLIALVAMIESLPTSLWRHILWKENIDFISPASFLRRITPSQYCAIKTAYDQLFKGHIPATLHTWHSNRRHRSEENRQADLEKLLTEPYTFEEHHASKGSWAYNLLHIDFGFNQYPHGPDSDHAETEFSLANFWSIKNHQLDFVVNQFNGLYWWFYRTARSNFVYRPNRKVQLNTHICPGFWYTLFIHLVFWIGSPAAATTFFASYTPSGLMASSEILIPASLAVVGSLTSIWLTLALIKLIFRKAIVAIAEKLRTKVKEDGSLLYPYATYVSTATSEHPFAFLFVLGITYFAISGFDKVLQVLEVFIFVLLLPFLLIWYIHDHLAIALSTPSAYYADFCIISFVVYLSHFRIKKGYRPGLLD